SGCPESPPPSSTSARTAPCTPRSTRGETACARAEASSRPTVRGCGCLPALSLKRKRPSVGGGPMIRAEGPLEGPVRRGRLASAGLPRGAGSRARLGSGLAVALLGASAALLGVRLGRGGAGGLRAEQIAGDLLGAGRLLPRELAAAEVTVGGGGGVDR